MTWMPQVYNWLTDRLFPPHCLLCGDPGSDGLDLCAGCLGDLPRNESACPQCAAPLARGSALVCGECLKRPPPFGRCIAPYRYGVPLDHLILRHKFHRDVASARLLGTLMTRAMVTTGVQGIVPVPLHPSRLRARGFNQALELARPLARSLGLPLFTNTCRRTLATEPQSLLHARQRQRNVRGAFQVAWPDPPRRLAVVDDVLSTGATVAELTRALQRAGVKEVEVWVLARAERPG